MVPHGSNYQRTQLSSSIIKKKKKKKICYCNNSARICAVLCVQLTRGSARADTIFHFHYITFLMPHQNLFVRNNYSDIGKKKKTFSSLLLTHSFVLPHFLSFPPLPLQLPLRRPTSQSSCLLHLPSLLWRCRWSRRPPATWRTPATRAKGFALIIEEGHHLI